MIRRCRPTAMIPRRRHCRPSVALQRAVVGAQCDTAPADRLVRSMGQGTGLSAGARMRFVGSELGVFALRALHHGAAHALCADRYPQDARIATAGPKHSWRPARIARRRDPAVERGGASPSFETFAAAIDIIGSAKMRRFRIATCWSPPDRSPLAGHRHRACVRAYCGDGRAAPRVLPARATCIDGSAMGLSRRRRYAGSKAHSRWTPSTVCAGAHIRSRWNSAPNSGPH